MNIFDDRKMTVDAKFETYVSIKKINPKFSLSATNDVVLERAHSYRLRKADLFRSPIRFLRFYCTRRYYDSLAADGATAAQHEVCNNELVSRYSFLVYGEKLCIENLRQLIAIETLERVSRNSIRRTLMDLNVNVDRSGVLRIDPPIRPLRWIGFGILGFSAPLAVLLFIILIEGLFFVKCPPRCAIVGATELFMLSALFVQFGSKLAFVHRRTQIALARRLSHGT